MHPMAFHLRFPALFAVGLAVALACGACSKDGDVSAEGDVKDIVNQAWTAYRLNEFHDAIRHFEAARAAAAEGSDDWAMATYGLGIVWDLQRPGEDPVKATKLFTEALEKAPNSPIAPWVELALVRQKHLVPVGKEPDYDAVKAGFKAGVIVKEAAALVGGSGGGKPDLAMAGGKDASKLNDAVNAAADIVAKQK